MGSTTTAQHAPMFVDRDLLRARFVTAMSSMYRAEVPLYGDLIDIVRDVNAQAFENCTRNGQGNDASAIIASSERLTLERHGAIRLGTPFELRTFSNQLLTSYRMETSTGVI